MLYDETNCEKKKQNLEHSSCLWKRKTDSNVHIFYTHLYYNIVFNIRILYNLQ